MRKKIALAIAGAALVATFGPATPASAVCIEWYYQLTGQCSPCNTAGYVLNKVEDKTGVKDPVELMCVA